MGRAGPQPGARPGAAPAGDEIAALVASWPLDRAELVARAFTVYFHLANLAEEQQRVRALRERDAGVAPVRESLAAAVGRAPRQDGRGTARDLLGRLGCTRCSPRTRPRPGAGRWSPRCAGSATCVTDADDTRHGASEQAAIRRRLREEIDLLWRTSLLRAKAMTPLDEVRTVMAVFDETLFRVAPRLYRALDDARPTGARRRSPAFLRFGSWVGGDRDGNPFVTAQVTRETAVIQAEHVLRALENATTRIGRALTVHADAAPPAERVRPGPGAAEAAHPELLAELAARSPGEPYRTFLLYLAQRLAATRLRHADLAYRSAAEFLADLRLVQESLAAAGAIRQAFGELQHLIWQVETFGFHLAEPGDPPAQRGARRGAGRGRGRAARCPSRRRGARDVPAVSRDPGPVGVGGLPPVRGQLHPSADDIAAVYELAARATRSGPPPVLDVVPLFESGEDLTTRPRCSTRWCSSSRSRAAGRHRAALEVMLGYSDSAKELGPVSATLRLYDAQARWPAGRRRTTCG